MTHLAHQAERITAACDTECYRDYWLCRIDPADKSPGWAFQLFDGHPLDAAELARVLSLCRIVTFNGLNYDLPMITLALSGASNYDLKQASDEIIQGGLLSWQFYQRWNLMAPTWIDHIDLFNVAPGDGSLKMYGGKMHSRKLQDLPIDPSGSIGLFQRAQLREYCGNDTETTLDLWRTFPAQIALREQMSEKYAIDLRSKSDAQIAEAVMKSLIPHKVQVPHIEAGTSFYYQPPPYLKFINLRLLDALARLPFVVNDSGGVDMPAELENTSIHIGASTYRFAKGGLHSTESSIVHTASATHSLQDVDVASYYPSLIINQGFEPPQLAGYFQRIYKGWFESRMKYKHAGDKKNANSFKTLLNGTFGKTGSPYSIFYYPQGLIQVTITGQLSMLMLIEALELSGIPVISANTDGLVIKCRRDLEWLRDQIIAWWCQITGFETEAADYLAICSRDVNSYVVIRQDMTVKLKGAYAPPEPGPSGWPNPTGQICVDAVVAYLTKGQPISDTIRACTDVRKFVHIRNVRGGGIWVSGDCPNRSASQRAKREVVIAAGWVEQFPKVWHNTKGLGAGSLDDAYLACFTNAEEIYLGKAVRWYYATGSAGYIRYKLSGNRVSTTAGCRPLMELPDTLPDDINYDFYIAESHAMLAAMGVQLQ